MIDDRESPFEDAFNHNFDRNWYCEFCDRSVEARFGGIPSAECPSCRSDWKRAVDANDGSVEAE